MFCSISNAHLLDTPLLFALGAAGVLGCPPRLQGNTSFGCLAALLTLANPKVSPSTLGLIGMVPLQIPGESKFAVRWETISGSFLFFAGLAFGASILTPIVAHTGVWQVIDSMVVGIMFFLAIVMLRVVNFI